MAKKTGIQQVGNHEIKDPINTGSPASNTANGLQNSSTNRTGQSTHQMYLDNAKELNNNPISTYGSDGYNHKGFDANGYDRNGFDAQGYDKDGYNKEGYNAEGYNRQGYNSKGFNSEGYNALGFNEKGYNKDGYDKEGYDKGGFNSEGHSKDYQKRYEAIAQQYDDNLKKIDDGTLNAKNEAYQAQMNASKYAENYLKQAGLANTGMTFGQAQNINNTYMNALNEANFNKMDAQMTAKQNYMDNLARMEEQETNYKQKLSDQEREERLLNEANAREDARYNEQKNAEYSANAVSRAETLLPTYMNNPEKLESYLAEVNADPNISEADKKYINYYVSGLDQVKSEETALDEATLKTDRDSTLTDIDKYLKKGKIKGHKLTSEQADELGDLKNALFNAKTPKEMQKVMEEIEIWKEEFIYNDTYSETETTKVKTEKFNEIFGLNTEKVTGSGTSKDPYKIEGMTKDMLKKALEEGKLEVGQVFYGDNNIYRYRVAETAWGEKYIKVD